MTAAHPIEGRFSRKWAAVVIILVALVPAYAFIKIETAPAPIRFVTVEGSASAGSYGNATSVWFSPNGGIPGYVNYMFSAAAVNGKYSVSLPDYYSYVPGVSFGPHGGIGTCWAVGTFKVDQAPNTIMTLNFSCALPPSSAGSSSSNNGTMQTTTVTVTVGSGTPEATTTSGETFYMDNVTSIMWAEDPGTFHFNNGSVTFRGVTFQTICTDHFSDCPGIPPPTSGVTYTVASGASIVLNVTFPDHSSEMVEGAFPLVPVHFSAYSHHTDPQAGVLIVWTNSSPEYKSYLLVSA